MRTHLRTKNGSACGYEGDRTSRFPSSVTCCDCRASVDMADREVELFTLPRHLRVA